MDKNESKEEKKLKEQELIPIDEGFLELLSLFEPEASMLASDDTPTLKQPIADNLWKAAQILGRNLGIIFKIPKKLEGILTTENFIETLSEMAECRVCKMKLEQNWWKEDCGSLLCFQLDKPMFGVLLRKKSHYFFINPQDNTETKVDKEFSKKINPWVYRFYKTLPNKPLHWRDIVHFIFGDIKTDLRHILSLHCLMGVISLFLPIFTGIIFEDILPYADVSRLTQSIFLLAMLTIVSVSFGFCVATYMIRLRFTSNIVLQSAIWDRVLKLPLSFFKQYNAGDLASRVRGIDSIQQFLTSSLISKLLSGLFAVFNLFLMFYYHVWLAFVMAVLGLMAALFSILINCLQVKYQRLCVELEGKIQGVLYQLLTSIRKLRVAHREKEAFGVWTKFFSKKNHYFLKAQRNMIFYSVFNSLWMCLAFVVFFALVITLGKGLSLGHFLAFNVAFGQFFVGLFSVASTINGGLTIVPLFERIKPILESQPETESLGVDPGMLLGNIEIRNLHFNYSNDAPSVLEGVSFSIPKASFIAIVGQSGSGKSTLLRLMVGLEDIDEDHIFYDGHDLSTLNRRAFRKQLGVVFQNSMILPGSIYENIACLSPDISLKEAELAAEKMCLLEDIRRMPMGMFTHISERGGNISVGQRQRILLARAIAHNPKILLLDEATSALDNQTQALIYEQLATMQITRVVVAHRFTTIKNADCIYVLDKGKLIQSGSYSELVKTPGLFMELLKNQL